MSESVSVSFETKCVCYIEAVQKIDSETKKCAPCTGFFWRDGDVPYLVTNRHCVTGKNHHNQLFSDGAFEPTHLNIFFHEHGEPVGEGVTNYRWKAISISLYEDGDPIWFEHQNGPAVDVVAIALDSPKNLSTHCVNDRAQYDQWKAEVGSDCFIVGYPEGLSGAESTPIWKRASIATEPELDYKQKPIFLCDSATRKGLSGGPVFGKATGFFDQEYQRIDPYGDAVSFLGQWAVFLGIYSGREGDEADGFQLCRVWKKSVLIDLMSNKLKAASPFVRIRPQE